MEQHIQFNTGKMALTLLDQRYLPLREEYLTCSSVEEIIHALQAMVVRGAPAIGVTAAWGCVIAAHEVLRKTSPGTPPEAWQPLLREKVSAIANARPTAINLAWAVSKLCGIWHRTPACSLPELATLWEHEACNLHAADIATNKKIGEYGAACLEDGDTIMTHCNAGALATAGFGTALGVIYAAYAKGKDIKVIANETRPFLQGARLTAYELKKHGVPVTLACDNACALLMQKKLVHKVIVGADRIAANGDTANKIGTYGVALLAKAHSIPFYVAAPLSTVDRNMTNGSAIPIEERPTQEVTHIGSVQITPNDIPVYNFAFDVTPAELITGIITEKGVLCAPYKESINQAFELMQSAE